MRTAAAGAPRRTAGQKADAAANARVAIAAGRRGRIKEMVVVGGVASSRAGRDGQGTEEDGANGTSTGADPAPAGEGESGRGEDTAETGPTAAIVIGPVGAGARPPRYFEPLPIPSVAPRLFLVFKLFKFVLGRWTSQRRRPARRRAAGRAATTAPIGRAHDRPVHRRAPHKGPAAGGAAPSGWRSAVGRVKGAPRGCLRPHSGAGGRQAQAHDRQPPAAPQRQPQHPASGGGPPRPLRPSHRRARAALGRRWVCPHPLPRHPVGSGRAWRHTRPCAHRGTLPGARRWPT